MSTIENLPSGPLGHWFCSFCNDEVNLRKPWGRWDERRGVRCPVCGNNSADWMPDAPKTLFPEEAKERFAEIYDKIKNLPPA